MKPLTKAIEDYLALRRSLGYKLREYGGCLHEFAASLKRRCLPYITSKLAVEYASQRQHEKPVSWSRRLCIIRGFARYRAGDDPRTEVPAPTLLPFRSRRAKPYLYSEDEIVRLLAAALNIESPHQLQSQTYYCFFGLLAVTGMRVGEAINLKPADVNLDEGVITIRGAKFDKTRLVPLHRTTRSVLAHYARLREAIYPAAPTFFVTSRGTKLEKSNVSRIFRELSRQIGIRGSVARHGPRLHDFRHRFAVETLLRWYREGDEVTRRMPVLSTYLGHSHVTGTYWYLTNTPELMVAAGRLLEQRWKGVA